jgi:hypothetical protein
LHRFDDNFGLANHQDALSLLQASSARIQRRREGKMSNSSSARNNPPLGNVCVVTIDSELGDIQVGMFFQG